MTRWKPVTFSQAARQAPRRQPGKRPRRRRVPDLPRPRQPRGALEGHRVRLVPRARCTRRPSAASARAVTRRSSGSGLPRSVGLASHAAHRRTRSPASTTTVAARRCHKPEVRRDLRYRKLAFARCADCHQDRHSGEFAKSDGGECAPCHTTAGFRPTLFGAEAHAQTALPARRQAHRVALLACHTAAPARLDLHVSKQACADCHANPHGDQFAKEMAQGGCAHCHEATGWNLPKIDHSTWPLTGAHATAMCESCHHPTPEDRKAGRGASYRGVAAQLRRAATTTRTWASSG